MSQNKRIYILRIPQKPAPTEQQIKIISLSDKRSQFIRERIAVNYVNVHTQSNVTKIMPYHYHKLNMIDLLMTFSICLICFQYIVCKRYT